MYFPCTTFLYIYVTLLFHVLSKQSSLSSYQDSSASTNYSQFVLKASEIVVDTLLEIGSKIPIIKEFAEILKKVLAVMKQASVNHEAIVTLHNRTVDIIEDLLRTDVWSLFR